MKIINPEKFGYYKKNHEGGYNICYATNGFPFPFTQIMVRRTNTKTDIYYWLNGDIQKM